MTTKNKIVLVVLIVAMALFIWIGVFKKQPVKIDEIENVQVAPEITYKNASTDLITVDTPLPGDVVGQNFRVTGKARGYYYFEASFPIELRDANNNLLSTSVAQAEGDWMTENFVPFSVNIIVPNGYTGEATLVLKKDNASDLPENDASISFPITVE